MSHDGERHAKSRRVDSGKEESGKEKSDHGKAGKKQKSDHKKSGDEKSGKEASSSGIRMQALHGTICENMTLSDLRSLTEEVGQEKSGMEKSGNEQSGKEKSGVDDEWEGYSKYTLQRKKFIYTWLTKTWRRGKWVEEEEERSVWRCGKWDGDSWKETVYSRVHGSDSSSSDTSSVYCVSD